jgi:threonine aldolase
MIDLRSDTVTKPTEAMRRAMAAAEVDDDVLGHDPTVAALEARVAAVLGKESALYVPSGTMANQLALRSHTESGDEIICEQDSHIYQYEAAAPAALSGCLLRLIPGQRGIFSASQLAEVFHPSGEVNNHAGTQKLVVLENTHNRGGGSIWPIEQIAAVELTARDAHLRLHLDGARLWNASVATGIPEAEYAKHFDSVSVCFSKGLGAPVGSALAGEAAFIRRAKRFRKQFGGGMRQAGIIAAGALYAMEHHRERLAADHANARLLAQRLMEIKGLEVDIEGVQTNMVYFNTLTLPAAELVSRLERHGVLVLATARNRIRLVTHLNVSAADMDTAAKAIGRAVAGG